MRKNSRIDSHAPRGSRRLAWLGLGLWLCGGAAQAQPLDNNDYTIDLVQGPVLGSGRIIGLGGAFTAIAEGIDGAPWNPASYGSRALWELDWFEWELTAFLLFPGAFAGDDVFNSGSAGNVEVSRSISFSAGFRLQFGDTGFGALPRFTVYQLDRLDSSSEKVDVQFAVANYGVARQFLDGQVVVGIGGRTASFSLSTPAGLNLVSFNGSGPEIGVLVRPADQSLRLGAAARAPVSSVKVAGSDADTDPDEIDRVAGFILPREVHMPWEVQIGVAWQLGGRPLNQRFVNPDHVERDYRKEMVLGRWQRERDQVRHENTARDRPADPEDPYRWLTHRARDRAFWRQEVERRAAETKALANRVAASARRRDADVANLSRQYVLFSAEVLLTGRTEDGVGVEGFASQVQQRSGKGTTLGLRFGVETEPWARRLKLRAGSYLEPSRFDHVGYRLHATAGFDLRLFRWDLFGLLEDFDLRLSASTDVSDRYFDWGIGIGFWH